MSQQLAKYTKLSMESALLTSVFLIIFASSIETPINNDLSWHLAAGQFMLDHKAIATTDPFSYTHLGQPWVNVQWLSQIIFATIYRTFGGINQPGDPGTSAIAIFTGLIATAGCALVFRLLRGTVFIRGAIILLAAMTASLYWQPRPLIFTWLLTAATYYFLWRFQTGQSTTLWPIPLLMVLWVNLHGGYSVGLLLIACTLVGESISRLTRQVYALPWQSIRKLAVIGFLSLGATLINPFGIQAWILPFHTAGMKVLTTFVDEWKSPTFSNPNTLGFFLMLFAPLVVSSLSGKRLNFTHILLLLSVGSLALLYQRNIYLLAIIAAPILCYAITEVFDFIPANADATDWLKFKTPLNWLIIVVLGLTAAIATGSKLNPEHIEQATKKEYPIHAIEYLNDHSTTLIGPIFNSYNTGGYLILYAPDYPVFVDSRTDIYGDDFLENWLAIADGKPAWETTFARYNIQTVLLENHFGLTAVLRNTPDWSLVYTDQQASIFQHHE